MVIYLGKCIKNKTSVGYEILDIEALIYHQRWIVQRFKSSIYLAIVQYALP
jgi:hypothetical protein